MGPFNYFNPAGRNISSQLLGAMEAKQGRQMNDQAMQMNDQTMQMRDESMRGAKMQNDVFEMLQVPKARQEAMIMAAKDSLLMLQNGDIEGTIDFLGSRAQKVSELGGDPSHTLEPYNMLRMANDQSLPIKQRQQALGEGIGMLQNFIAASEITQESKSQVRSTKQLENGYAIQSTDEGLRVAAPDGSIVEGDEAFKIIQQNEDLLNKRQLEKARIDIRKQAIGDAIDKSKEFFEKANTVRSSLGAYTDIIAAIDGGANSGKLQSFLPTFKEQTVLLQNAANRLGLNVISGASFGALSEGEMRMAMETAVPNLPPAELRKWAIDKRNAQEKLMNELNKAAIELGRGDVTVSEYLEKMQNQEQDEFAGFEIVQ